MSAVNSKFAQALFPFVAAALLTAGCSDATGPGTENGSSGQVTDGGTAAPKPTQGGPVQVADTDSSGQLTDSGTVAATPTQGGGPVPSTPSLADAPNLNGDAPGDNAGTPLKVGFYTRTSPTENLRLAPGPGIVNVMSLGAPVQCWGGSSRFIRVAGVLVFQTTGLSSYYRQGVSAKVWLYRRSGTSWIAVDYRLVSVDNLDINAYLPEAVFNPKQSGTYSVLIQMSWWAMPVDTWLLSATANYDLTSQSEYNPLFYATSGPGGQCNVS